MNNGFIYLSRSLLESDVFASQKLLKIWIWCLLKSNFKDKHVPLKIGKGETVVKVKRGQFIFGRHKAEEELFIDGSTIYKSIKKLEQMEMINIDSNNQYSIITICNYDTYQDLTNYQVTTKEQPSNNQVTSKEQPSNTTNNYNKDNKESKPHLSDEAIDFNSLLEAYNKLTGKNAKVVNDKTKRQIKARFKEGYTKDDLWEAMVNCSKDPFHIEKKYNHFTLEFISRADKLDKYLTAKPIKENLKINDRL